MILVSACLAGYPCRYDGTEKTDENVVAMVRNREAIPVCPELLGGLSTPRIPSEMDLDGASVLLGKGKVLTEDGTDITQSFLKGAFETLKLCRLYGVERAVLKANSPSCGCGSIYDGTFSGNTKPGDGVTTALLKINGIPVKTV